MIYFHCALIEKRYLNKSYFVKEYSISRIITCGCYYHKPPIRRWLLNFWSAWLEEQIKKQRILNLDAFLKIMQFLKKDQLVFLENIIWKSYHWPGRLEKGTQTKKEPHWSFFLLKLLWKLWGFFFQMILK